MTIISDSVLTESLSARENQLAQIEEEQATEILSKIKSLYFALWKEEGIATTDQSAGYLTLEVRDTKLSNIESKNTSLDLTTKQPVAAPTEIDGGGCFRKIRISNHRREEIKTVDVLEEEIAQSQSTCLKPDKKVDSGLGNAFDGDEANSSICSTKETKSIKVINKDWRSRSARRSLTTQCQAEPDRILKN